MARLIVVEDNVELASLIAITARRRGHAVKEAHTGQVALAALVTGGFELAIVDLLLPDIRGGEILQELKLRGVPSLVMSGVYKGEKFAQEAIRLYGVRGYFEKPFELDALLAKIDAIVGAGGRSEDDDDLEVIEPLEEVAEVDDDEPLGVPEAATAPPRLPRPPIDDSPTDVHPLPEQHAAKAFEAAPDETAEREAARGARLPPPPPVDDPVDEGENGEASALSHDADDLSLPADAEEPVDEAADLEAIDEDDGLDSAFADPDFNTGTARPGIPDRARITVERFSDAEEPESSDRASVEAEAERAALRGEAAPDGAPGTASPNGEADAEAVPTADNPDFSAVPDASEAASPAASRAQDPELSGGSDAGVADPGSEVAAAASRADEAEVAAALGAVQPSPSPSPADEAEVAAVLGASQPSRSPARAEEAELGTAPASHSPAADPDVRAVLPLSRRTGEFPAVEPTARRAPEGPTAGDLSTTSVPRLLNAYYQARHHGELRLKQGQVQKVVHFEQGRPTYAASNLASERFARFCARKGVLPSDRAAEVAALVSSEQLRTAEAMIRLGLITAEQRAALVEEQVKEIIWSTFTWKEGAFSFTTRKGKVPELIKLAIFPGDLILQGVARTETLLGLREKLPSSRRMFPTADPPYGLHEIQLSGGQALLLAHADGSKTIEDLITLTNLSEREALATLRGLELLGLVEERRDESKRRRISFGL